MVNPGVKYAAIATTIEVIKTLRSISPILKSLSTFLFLWLLSIFSPPAIIFSKGENYYTNILCCFPNKCDIIYWCRVNTYNKRYFRNLRRVDINGNNQGYVNW